MQRRSFLKALLGVPFLGFFWPEKVLAWKATFGYQILNPDYVCIIHPYTWSAFISITRRGQWKDAWRTYRRSGERELSAKQVWEKFGKILDAPLTGEVGHYENVRFIQSDSVLG